ncbi:MAG: DUF362 domain-containing protein [Candidatus Eisenbacteria bacterium]|nr:DUF362 domain-containing protein [Candidatus Eisenbacteria bacterium]
MAVFLENVKRYRLNEIEDAIRRALDALGVDLDGKRTAFIKPNLVIAANPSTAVVTHPAVVEAIVNVLRESGVSDISLGDGPGVGLDVERVFCRTGYADLCERLGLNLVNLNTAERRKRTWKYGELGVPAAVLDTDLYINVPKLKTHGYTTVTLSIKNHKGLLSEPDKKRDHQLGLHDPLAQHAALRPPDLIVLDGVVGVEGDGPLHGRRIRAGILAVGTNMLETDVVAARHMGFDPMAIKHLAIAAELGLGNTDPEVIGSAPSLKFKPANEEFGRVVNIYSWRDPTACSMCIDSFSGAVQLAVRRPRYWFTLLPKLAFWGIVGGLHVIQGREARLPLKSGRVLCLGQCTRELAEREGLVHLKGCPPTPEDVAETLRREL